MQFICKHKINKLCVSVIKIYQKLQLKIWIMSQLSKEFDKLSEVSRNCLYNSSVQSILLRTKLPHVYEQNGARA